VSALAQRLARLQQQAGLPTRTPPRDAVSPAVSGITHGQPSEPAPTRMPQRAQPRVDPREQLRRLLQLRPGAAPRPVDGDRRVDGTELAPGVRYTESWHPVRLPDTLALHGIGVGDVPTAHVLAFDTETTGLAGGTGTRAFMIGAADWRDGGLRLRQLTLTTLGGEAAMLREFATWLDPDTVVMSYNGKSYDRPLLSTRYTLARLPDPVRGRGHIDLLHPVRRRYKGLWENCRLVTAERELLGVLRDNDLPGSEAPGAWLQYLRGGSAANLRRVATHNRDDLLSLWGIVGTLQDG
jgi:uncharacterized protein YprB with RNaseH-like and TPR domain